MPELTIREKIIEVTLSRPFREPSVVRLDRDMLWLFKEHALGHIYKSGKVVAIGVWRREDLEQAARGRAKCMCYLGDFVYSRATGQGDLPRKSVIHKNGDVLDNTLSNLARREAGIPVIRVKPSSEETPDLLSGAVPRTDRKVTPRHAGT